MNMNEERRFGINIPEKTKEFAGLELNQIIEILDSLEAGVDEVNVYADTNGPMEALDEMLENLPAYQATLDSRKKSSRKCLNADVTIQKEGLAEIRAWVNQIKGML